MKFPWANTLLLVLIAAELVSGFFGLVSSSPREWYFIVAHRISGYGIVVILVWKGANVLFSLRWKRAAAPRTASVVLMALLAVTLALGFAWSFVGPFGWAWFSGVSWHIYVGAALIPLLVWHALYHTRGFPVGFWADRRTFLRLAALAVAATAAWQVGELSAKTASLSGARRRFTGSHEATSFSGNAFPLTSWLNDRPARVDPAEWRLTVGGAVERELSLGYDDLAAAAETTATIDCTGGWYSTQVWSGVAVSDLLARAGPTDAASSVTFTSVTGYYRRFSMAEAAGYMLASHVGGETLSHGHGFPLRLVAPDKRGFEWVKWVVDIRVNTTPKWLQPPLPIQ